MKTIVLSILSSFPLMCFSSSPEKCNNQFTQFVQVESTLKELAKQPLTDNQVKEIDALLVHWKKDAWRTSIHQLLHDNGLKDTHTDKLLLIEWAIQSYYYHCLCIPLSPKNQYVYLLSTRENNAGIRTLVLEKKLLIPKEIQKLGSDLNSIIQGGYKGNISAESITIGGGCTPFILTNIKGIEEHTAIFTQLTYFDIKHSNISNQTNSSELTLKVFNLIESIFEQLKL